MTTLLIVMITASYIAGIIVGRNWKSFTEE